MALYNPPKGNNWGEVLQMAGTTAIGAGGALALTGAAAPVGLAVGAIGGIMSGIGSLLNRKQEIKKQQYDQNYQSRIQGESNLNASINNIRQLTQKQ